MTNPLLERACANCAGQYIDEANVTGVLIPEFLQRKDPALKTGWEK
jgi:hypothetical protein